MAVTGSSNISFHIWICISQTISADVNCLPVAMLYCVLRLLLCFSLILREHSIFHEYLNSGPIGRDFLLLLLFLFFSHSTFSSCLESGILSCFLCVFALITFPWNIVLWVWLRCCHLEMTIAMITYIAPHNIEPLTFPSYALF